MSVKYSVLEMLKNAEIISGEIMAKELGVSRNSIWKAINSLRKDGYIIKANTKSGYNLSSFTDVLCPDSIKTLCNFKDIDVYVYDSIESTNTLLKEWAKNGKAHATVLIAKEQTAGKGRLGRKFSSPANTGIYISILLRPRFSVEEALSITTSAAVAVAKTLEEVSNKETKIKWVNDIFIDDKKVCGILTEASIDFETASLEYAVLGVGINLFKPKNDFDDEIKSIAGAVFEGECKEEIKTKTVALFIDKFFEIYKNLPENNYISEYRKRSYLTGKEVSIKVHDKTENGKVLDIDDKANLVVQLENGKIKAFSAGEALLKKNK